MKGWTIENDKVRVGVTEEGGHLDPVTFHTDKGDVSPMHVAPWANETLEPSTPPILRILRGDFFCAPFSVNDVSPDEDRVHGATANDTWREVSKSESQVELELAKSVMGAKVRKRLSIQPGQPIVYQQHTLEGGSGELPLGHHAMLRASEPLLLSFSPWLWGGTPPTPIETPETQGRSKLEYPQTFTDLAQVRSADGNSVDVSVFPALERSEEIMMLVADDKQPFAWSAATAANAGWVWFALKNPRTLRSTLLWMSNGGRDYAPWLGRHTKCLGIEEVTSYFHLGHKASSETNEAVKRGYATVLELKPDSILSVHYLFGLTPVPNNFGQVARIEVTTDGIIIKNKQEAEARVSCDLSFVTG
jgi:hypothetical protein